MDSHLCSVHWKKFLLIWEVQSVSPNIKEEENTTAPGESNSVQRGTAQLVSAIFNSMLGSQNYDS